MQNQEQHSFDPYHVWLGIPPKEQPPNHYRLLGLELYEDNPDVIDAAANRQSTYLQTMAAGPERKACQKILNEIANARLCLLTEERRQKYNNQLQETCTSSSENTIPIIITDEDQKSSISANSSHSGTSTKTSTRNRKNSKNHTSPWKLIHLIGVIVAVCVIGFIITYRQLNDSGNSTEKKSPKQRIPTGRQEPFKLGNE